MPPTRILRGNRLGMAVRGSPRFSRLSADIEVYVTILVPRIPRNHAREAPPHGCRLGAACCAGGPRSFWDAAGWARDMRGKRSLTGANHECLGPAVPRPTRERTLRYREPFPRTWKMTAMPSFENQRVPAAQANASP